MEIKQYTIKKIKNLGGIVPTQSIVGTPSHGYFVHTVRRSMGETYIDGYWGTVFERFSEALDMVAANVKADEDEGLY